MLTQAEQAILHFEDTHPTYYARKEEDIRHTFGIPAARYYQQLQLLLNDPDAEIEHPMLVRRLGRIRDQRVQARVERARTRRSP